jgi:hypothetical protein
MFDAPISMLPAFGIASGARINVAGLENGLFPRRAMRWKSNCG